MPGLDGLPFILEKSNRLARIDRYLSGLEELQSFFSSVRQLLPAEPSCEIPVDVPAFRSSQMRKLATFEASRAREKIQQEQRLCQTYMRQYDTLVQLVSKNDERLQERALTCAPRLSPTARLRLPSVWIKDTSLASNSPKSECIWQDSQALLLQ